MNAKEMRERLKQFKQCEGIEEWLADFILELFRESSGNTIAYPPYKLDNRGWAVTSCTECVNSDIPLSSNA